jgi:hypothetical protein
MNTVLTTFQNKAVSVLEGTMMGMFKELTPEEEITFRKYAHDNPNEQPTNIMHPVVQDEYINVVLAKPTGNCLVSVIDGGEHVTTYGIGCEPIFKIQKNQFNSAINKANDIIDEWRNAGYNDLEIEALIGALIYIRKDV